MDDQMTELPALDKELRLVLDIFKDRRLQSGEGLAVSSLATARGGLKAADVLNGLKAGVERGLLKNGPNGFIMLTEAGFAEL